MIISFNEIIYFNNYLIEDDFFEKSIVDKKELNILDLHEKDSIFGININRLKISGKYILEIINDLNKNIENKIMKTHSVYLDIFSIKESSQLLDIGDYELSDLTFNFFNFTTGLILLKEIKHKEEIIFSAQDFSLNDNISEYNIKKYLTYSSIKGRNLINFEFDLMNNENIYIDLIINKNIYKDLTFFISYEKTDLELEKKINQLENVLNENLSEILNLKEFDLLIDNSNDKLTLKINFNIEKNIKLINIYEIMFVSKILFENVLFIKNEDQFIMLDKNNNLLVLENEEYIGEDNQA